MCKNNAIGQFDRYGREGVKENLSEKQFFKYIFEDLKKKGNEINSGIIIPLFLYDVTMPLSISSRTTSQYSAYNYMYSHFQEYAI